MPSRLSSPIPPCAAGTLELAKKPERQFLATEVSRDFIPPCPMRISPAPVAALGPALGNRDGTLATNSILTVEQTACQTVHDRGDLGPALAIDHAMQDNVKRTCTGKAHMELERRYRQLLERHGNGDLSR